MLNLFADLRKATLISGVVIATSALWNVLVLILWEAARIANFTVSWPSLLSDAAIYLPLLFLGMPLPLFFLVLYRTDIRFELSTNLRRLVLALVAIQVINLGFYGVAEWHRGAHLYPTDSKLPLYGLSHWPHQTPVRPLVSEAIQISAILVLILFLTALYRQDVALPAEVGWRETRRVKNTAIVAACSEGLNLIAVTGLMYWLRLSGTGHHDLPGEWRIWLNAVFAFPGMIAPLIVYASIRTS